MGPQLSIWKTKKLAWICHKIWIIIYISKIHTTTILKMGWKKLEFFKKYHFFLLLIGILFQVEWCLNRIVIGHRQWSVHSSLYFLKYILYFYQCTFNMSNVLGIQIFEKYCESSCFFKKLFCFCWASVLTCQLLF